MAVTYMASFALIRTYGERLIGGNAGKAAAGRQKQAIGRFELAPDQNTRRSEFPKNRRSLKDFGTHLRDQLTIALSSRH